MKQNTLQWAGRSLATVAVVALVAACTEQAPLGPDRTAGRIGAAGIAPAHDQTDGLRLPDLTACPDLAAKAGSTLLLHAYAKGVQIYRWDGTTWKFVAPRATLFADAGYTGKVADHFGGPTWQTTSGSTVVGGNAVPCTPDASAIPWLLLDVVKNEGEGVFNGATQIQRLFTVSGKAPSTAGTQVDQIAEVPYTAEYLFYKP